VTKDEFAQLKETKKHRVRKQINEIYANQLDQLKSEIANYDIAAKGGLKRTKGLDAHHRLEHYEVSANFSSYESVIATKYIELELYKRVSRKVFDKDVVNIRTLLVTDVATDCLKIMFTCCFKVNKFLLYQR
jgi:hypothetical protein